MKVSISVILLVGLSACTDPANAPLFFSQTQTLGVGVGTGNAGGPADVTVGFKSQNVAVVPTIAGSESAPGRIEANASGATDALSTFGSFESQASSDGVGIGQFFATGLSSQRIAQGLGCAAAAKAGATNTQNVC